MFAILYGPLFSGVFISDRGVRVRGIRPFTSETIPWREVTRVETVPYHPRLLRFMGLDSIGSSGGRAVRIHTAQRWVDTPLTEFGLMLGRSRFDTAVANIRTTWRDARQGLL